MKKLQFRKFGKIKGFLVFMVGILFQLFLFEQINAQVISEIDTIKKNDITEDLNLSDVELKDFNVRAKQKIEQFLNYLKIISSAQETKVNRDLALKNALKLFIDSAKVEISWFSNDKWNIKSMMIKTYLYKLRALQTTNVKLDFYDLVYLTNFVKMPNGSYRASATFYQIFTKYSGDKIVYSDKTKKTIEIILERIEDEFYKEKRWTIVLGNIKVTESSMN